VSAKPSHGMSWVAGRRSYRTEYSPSWGCDLLGAGSVHTYPLWSYLTNELAIKVLPRPSRPSMPASCFETSETLAFECLQRVDLRRRRVVQTSPLLPRLPLRRMHPRASGYRRALVRATRTNGVDVKRSCDWFDLGPGVRHGDREAVAQAAWEPLVRNAKGRTGLISRRRPGSQVARRRCLASRRRASAPAVSGSSFTPQAPLSPCCAAPRYRRAPRRRRRAGISGRHAGEPTLPLRRRTACRPRPAP